MIVGVCYAGSGWPPSGWKRIVREDDQTAYSIPMRLAAHGRPIDYRRLRYLLGLAIAAGLVASRWAIRDLQPLFPSVPVWATVLLAGTGGWLTAVGGAWKDAPVEGFSGWKFLRSPVVATGWAAVLSPFTHDWVLLAVAAGGWSAICVETYRRSSLAVGLPASSPRSRCGSTSAMRERPAGSSTWACMPCSRPVSARECCPAPRWVPWPGVSTTSSS